MLSQQVRTLIQLCVASWSGFHIQTGRAAPNPPVNVRWFSDAACTLEIRRNAGYNWARASNGGQCIDIMSTDFASPPNTLFRGYEMNCAPDYAGSSGLFPATTLVVRIQNNGCSLCSGLPMPSACDTVHQAAAAGHCTQYQGDFAVWMIWDYPSADSQCGEAVPTNTVNYFASLGGDPITYIGDRREEFELPIGVLSTLLRSQDMQVLASARQGHAKDQWIDRIVIADSNSDVVVDVGIKMNLTRFNRASLLPNAFETMDVKMEWWHPGLLEIMPPGDAQFTHWSGINLGFGRVRYHEHVDAGNVPRREAIIVQSRSLKILIISSTAREYFPEQAHLGVEYSHLDVEVMEMTDEDQLEGILPELWRFRPMSEQTRLMRKEPNYEELVNISNAFRNATMATSSAQSQDGKMPIIMPSGVDKTCADGASDEKKVVAVASVEGLSGSNPSLSEGNAMLESSDSVADI